MAQTKGTVQILRSLATKASSGAALASALTTLASAMVTMTVMTARMRLFVPPTSTSLPPLPLYMPQTPQVLHRVALLMSSSVTLETVFPLELFVMGLLTATMARMKLTALERPAPVLLMNLRVAMERVSMTVQNVMVAMIVLTDQMSWSVSQTDLVKTMNSLVVMVHVCL